MNIIKKKIDWWLVAILVVAAIFRLVFLGKVPVSLLWDETALGYNAYSIWQTGRDEYGKWFPLVFKSFGDFKPGLYVYLAVPSVALLGLSEVAVRLPAAVSGVMAVWGVYLLCGYWFSLRQVQRWAAMWLSICPWHVFFTRQAWEVGVMATLVVWGLVFWEKYLVSDERKRWWLFFGGALLGLTLATYQSAKFLTPILVGMWVWARWEGVKRWRLAQWGIGLACVTVMMLVIFGGSVLGQGGRIGVMSIFSYGRGEDEATRLASEMGTAVRGLRYQVFFGDVIFFGRSILGRYLNHFSPRFLLFEGDWQNVRHGVPYMGQLLVVQLVLVIWGGWAVTKLEGRVRWFLWGWLLMAPLPAALTRDNVQAVRSFLMVVPVAILAGVASAQWWEWVREKGVWRKLTVGLVGLFTGFQVVYFWDSYLFHMKFYNAQESQYGYKEAISLINNQGGEDERVVFTSRYGQPYIYWLFYNRISPREYQKQARLTESEVGDVGKVERVGNVYFREIYWVADKELAKTILVGDELSLPRGVVERGGGRVLGDIYFPNGKLAFRVVRTSEDNE